MFFFSLPHLLILQLVWRRARVHTAILRLYTVVLGGVNNIPMASTAMHNVLGRNTEISVQFHTFSCRSLRIDQVNCLNYHHHYCTMHIIRIIPEYDIENFIRIIWTLNVYAIKRVFFFSFILCKIWNAEKKTKQTKTRSTGGLSIFSSLELVLAQRENARAVRKES